MISDVGLGSQCHHDSLCKTNLPPNRDGATYPALGWCCFPGCRLLAPSSSQRSQTIVPCIGQRRCVVPGHPHRMHACVAAMDSQSHNLFLKQTHNNHCFLEPPGIPKGPDCSDQHFRIQNPGPNQMDCPRKFELPRSNEIQVVTNSMTYIQPCTRSCGMHRKTWIFA